MLSISMMGVEILENYGTCLHTSILKLNIATVSSSLIGAQFGDFNQIINENDGTSRVCVIFMDHSTVMVQGILRTANSTAIGIIYNLSIVFHNNFIIVCTYTPSLSVSPSPSSPLSLPIYTIVHAVSFSWFRLRRADSSILNSRRRREML